MTDNELSLIERIEEYINIAVKRDVIERKIEQLRNKITNIKSGLEEGSLTNYRREIVVLIDKKSKINTSLSNARSIYLSILSNSSFDSIKEVFESFLNKRNELVNKISLSEKEQEDKETTYSLNQRLSYYNAILNYMSSQYGMALPADFVKILKD